MLAILPEQPAVTLAATDLSALMAREICFAAGLDYDSIDSDALADMSLDETTILTAESEVSLFAQMNLAYYRASMCRAELEGDSPDQPQAVEAARMLEQADLLRNRLAVVFHKLTVSVAKGFVTPRHALDELVSEGDAVLLRAITLFDPSRGFRFSTYATHALRRRLARYISSRQHQYAVPVDFREAPPIPDGRRWTLAYQQQTEARAQWLESAIYKLDQRERYIVRCRFGWGREFEPRTLQDIADELGVSRERVRQLEARAMRKLQDLAEAYDG
jgi:RNA polymerase sigma factor (sigma-70 family)